MTILTWLGILLPLTSILCGVISFISHRKHLLSALLSLEFLMLSIFWLMSIHMNSIAKEAYLALFFLTLVVCEGALGLSLLVSIVRTHGNDCFNTFNSLQC
uniref:NADH dehydrogenase subunit 4L n=1 Tax=Eiconaxius baja TaxID=2893296 RepID=UPI001EDD8BE7|nr:NADH dehydrogenase subunit 4L [Eiconaxius baja]UIB39164.1 NADH dehydrogenase subunit 4L [Eiconaxius baja]